MHLIAIGWEGIYSRTCGDISQTQVHESDAHTHVSRKAGIALLEYSYWISNGKLRRVLGIYENNVSQRDQARRCTYL
jgi:hypothetical protein